MGMTIDDSHESAPMSREEVVETLKTMVFGIQAFEKFNAKEREALNRAWSIINQYDNRLKADKVAMLTDLQLEIEEEAWIQSYKSNYEKEEEAHTISNMIQSRIDKLKENKNESV